MKILLSKIKMLFRILLVVVTVGVSFTAHAQYPYTFAVAGSGNYDNSIVRHYTEDRAVVYYEKNNRGYVSLVDVLTGGQITVALDPGITANDMCILGDSVFLCGQELLTYGCIVSIDINNFYNSTVPVTYFEPSYWIFVNLKRIAGYEYATAYSNHGKLLLVCDIDYACDGSELFPNNNPNTYTYTDINNHSRCTLNGVFEVSIPFSHGASNNSHTQKVLRMMNPFEHNEIIHDVVVTDNYVTFVGLETDSDPKITLHRCLKNQSVLNKNHTYLNDFRHYYTYTLPSFGTPSYRAVALSGDDIAIVTTNETSSNSPLITERTIDLSTCTMTHAQFYQGTAIPTLKDVTYIPSIEKLLLLFDDIFPPTGANGDIFCPANPYNTSASYVELGITENKKFFKYNSIDAMEQSYFISTGGDYGLNGDISTFHFSATCYEMDNFPFYKDGILNNSTGYFNYDQHLSTPGIWCSTAIPIISVLDQSCIEY